VRRKDRETLQPPWPTLRAIKKNKSIQAMHDQVFEACVFILETTGDHFSKLRSCRESGNPGLYCPFRGQGPINWTYQVQRMFERLNGGRPNGIDELDAYYRQASHLLPITEAGVQLLELLDDGEDLADADPVALMQAHPQRSGGHPTEGWLNAASRRAMPLSVALMRVSLSNTQDQRRKRAGCIARWIEDELIPREDGYALLRDDWRPTLIPTIERWMGGKP
jgi:hypothetical protein